MVTADQIPITFAFSCGLIDTRQGVDQAFMDKMRAEIRPHRLFIKKAWHRKGHGYTPAARAGFQFCGWIVQEQEILYVSTRRTLHTDKTLSGACRFITRRLLPPEVTDEHRHEDGG
jgi:hypothetical protein